MSSSIEQVAKTVTSGVRGNSELESKWIASAPPEMQAQMKAQLEMQKQQELMQLVGQLMKQMSEMSKSVIRNVGG
ncbi:MAG: hypothetical protein JXB05_37125 [Myxococcaceae bacterium]|nr:hypothetical protein [Myxococcaceae bacterium]